MKNNWGKLVLVLVIGMIAVLGGCKNAAAGDDPADVQRLTGTGDAAAAAGQDETDAGDAAEKSGTEGAGSTAGQTKENAADGGEGGLKGRKAGTVINRGGYIEESIGLPASSDGGWRTMTVLEDGALACYAANEGLFVSRDDGKSWECRIDFTKDEKGYFPFAAIAKDGQLALIRYSTVNGKSTGWIVYYDRTGNRLEWEFPPAGSDKLHRLAFDEKGELYVCSLHGRTSRMDKETGELTRLCTTIQDPGNLVARNGKLYFLEEHYVEVYDLEQEKILEQDPVLDDFCREYIDGKLNRWDVAEECWITAVQEDIIYIACEEGIFRHTPGGAAMEQVVDGQQTSFGDPDGYISALEALDNGVFLLLPPVGDNLIRIHYDPEQASLSEKELYIYSLRENERVRQAVSSFRLQYPEINVIYQTGMEEESAVTLVDALKNLNVELMSGKGPDVLVLDGINASVYADKGMLADLGSILEEAQRENELFENVAGTCRTQEGTYVIPATFCVPLIFAGQEDLQKGGELETLAELTGEIASGLEKGSVTGAVTPLQELRQLAPVYGPTWIKDGKLDEEAVREFLLAAKKMYDADMAAMDENMVEVLKDWGDSGFISTRAADRLIGYSRIGFGLAGEIQGDLGAVGQVMKEDGKIAFDLWKGPMGAGFVPKNKLSVAANARDMDSAKKFVSWMLSDKEQQISFNDGLPVNRTAFEKRCEPNDNVFYQTWRLPDGDKEISWAFPEAEVCSRFRGIVEKVDVCLETDAVVEEAVLTYGAEVLNGDRVCDSALREIKNAVVLYLAEQN